MNVLEFIKKEIDTYKQLKEQAILRIPDEDDEIQLHLLQRRINAINERLPIFEQIKSELEAWRSVKELIHNSNGVYLLRVDSDDEDDKEHYIRIEKALEAKHE